MRLEDLKWYDPPAPRHGYILRKADFDNGEPGPVFWWIIEHMADDTYTIRRPGAYTHLKYWHGLDALAAQCVLFYLNARNPGGNDAH